MPCDPLSPHLSHKLSGQHSYSSVNLDEVLNQTLVLILAGGQGSRLEELTVHRAKPDIEFGGNFRIIDFPLSNCVNSGLRKIGVVTQYKSQSLIRHLIKGWANQGSCSRDMFEVLPAAQQCSTDWYKGTADALYQNLPFILSSGARYVMVLAGDHIYKMDYRPFLRAHLQRQAELSVCCMPVRQQEAAGQLGVMQVDNNERILGFQEKPAEPAPLLDEPGYTLASMGNYIFNTQFLVNQLNADARNQASEHDFGKDVIPSVIHEHRVFAYRFDQAPGSIVKPYWRDVGTLDGYWQANMAILGQHPPFDVYDQAWPILSYQHPLPPAKILDDSAEHGCDISNSMLCGATEVTASNIRDSIIFSNCTVRPNAVIEKSLILPGGTVGEGAYIRHAIVDSGCVIPEGMCIGVDRQHDLRRGFRVSKQGVVLVTQAMLDHMGLKEKRSTPSQSSLFHDEHAGRSKCNNSGLSGRAGGQSGSPKTGFLQ